MEFDSYPPGIENYTDSPREAEKADDVVGSGVFSPERATVHGQDGVFAASYSLPGYVARENLMGGSEVIDRQTGTPIEVYVAGATSAAQFMPSTQPRYPWPDRDGYLGGAISKAWAQDHSGHPRAQDISDMPADFLGPVRQYSPIEPRPTRGPDRALSGALDFLDGVSNVQLFGVALLAGVALAYLTRNS